MTFSLLLRLAKPYTGQLVLIGFLALISSVMTLAVPWLAAQALAGVVAPAEQDLGLLLAALVAVLLSIAALTILVAVIAQYTSGQILAGLRADAYAHIQSLPVSVHEERGMGELLAMMTHEIRVLSAFLASTIASVPANILTAAGACVLLFTIDPVMALVVPIMIPVFLLLAKLAGRKMRELAKDARAAEIDVFRRAESDLHMIPAIKSFAQEESFETRYRSAIEAARKAEFRQQRLLALVQPLTALAAALAALGIIAWGMEGTGGIASRAPEDLFAFLLYAALLTRPAGKLANLYGQFQWARGTLAKLQEIQALPGEPGYSAGQRIENARGQLSFEKVRFSYPGRETLFMGLDLDVAPGEVVAITGSNGAGKSTLSRLLLRFYELEGGRITLDDRDIAELSVQDLRRQIGYVPQSPLLFDGTLADNITLGAAELGDADVARACRLSGADEFIAELPEGLATMIGDHGLRLSGGQRQRIALARALIFDPSIFVLDEATSMYDLPSEAAFVETCVEALSDKTILIITHRPASLALADRVLALEDGVLHAVDNPAAVRR